MSSSASKTLVGGGAGIGMAVGPARLLPPRVVVGERRVAAEGIGAELDRFDAAMASTDAAMEQIAQRSTAGGPVGSELVDAHRAILRSEEIADGARRLIRERSLGAEWAVRLVVDELRNVFLRIQDERIRSRFEDVQAVAGRLLNTLLELPEIQLDDRFAGAIAIGYELSPLDALELHRLGVVGVATEHGGQTSHGAIVASALGLPYVFGVADLVAAVRPGETVCIDDTRGEIIVRPSGDELRAFDERALQAKERNRAMRAMRRAPAVTLDGCALSIGANIESAAEVSTAFEAGADHIGLVRTELLYLDRPSLPTEEQQLHDTLEILHAAGGRMVTFRTLDIGGDKLPAGVRIALGANPALGSRGIRFSLRRPDLFRTQLRALYRAAAVAPLRIMFPLVSCVTEVREARLICKQVCEELSAAGVSHQPSVAIGAMIETPSAVQTVDHIASVCDFISVGTNDLIQYAFAADRQNEETAYLYRPLHPAILRGLRQVLAVAPYCDVSLCGDMAGDPAYSWILLGLGLRTFSMTARQIPVIKSLLRKTSLAEAEELTAQALSLTSHEEIEALVFAQLGERFALELSSRGSRRRG